MIRLSFCGAVSGAVFGLSLTLAGAAAAQPVTVKIDNFTFIPAVVTIHAGQAVTWVNEDDAPHTVVAVDHSFRSKPVDTDEQYTATFAKPGTYEYFCSLHPHMVGKVVVQAP